MKKLTQAIIFALIIFFMIPSYVQAANTYTYFGGNAGLQFFTSEDSSTTYTNSGTGFHFRFGHWFDNNFGIDVGYSGIASVTELQNENGNTVADWARTHEYTTRLSYHFTDKLYGFLGGGFAAVQIDCDWGYGPAFSGGMGVKMPLSDRWYIGGEVSASQYSVSEPNSNADGTIAVSRFTSSVMIGFIFF